MPTDGILPTEVPWVGFPHLNVTAVIDIICVAFLIYQLLSIIRGRRAAHVLTGFAVIGIVYGIAVYARLELLRTLLATAAPYTAFALIVVFQSEIRRMLLRLGRGRVSPLRELERRETADEILLALAQLTQQKTGALIVIEQHIGLRTFIESGVSIDANLSRDLLCNIFHPGAALHDGAVILQGGRIAAAACFLPLNTNPALARELGTRHRAAIGVTEESDAIAIVASEETGRISVARAGEIELGVALERVEQYLTNRVPATGPTPAPQPEPIRQQGPRSAA